MLRPSGAASAVGWLLSIVALAVAIDSRAKAAPPLPARAPSLLESTEREARVVTAALRQDVERQLREARERQAAEPRAVRAELKATLDIVLRAPELDTSSRAALRGQLEAVLHETERLEARAERRVEERELAASSARDHQRVLNELENRQQRLQQLVDRFEGLVSEGRDRVAEEVVAAELLATAPQEPVAVSLGRQVALAGALRQTLAARAQRHKGVVDTLASVELTHVAMPDDQPIVYPAAEIWQDLTRRRAEYARVDMRRPTPAEQRIEKALSESTELDFAETPLRDVVDYLKDLHGIEIQFDTVALDEAGIPLDVAVTRKLRGITLRSALRLLLGSVDLTYILDKEVLLITTTDRAAQHVIAKVYPVGELVLPIQTPNMSIGMGGFGSPMGNNMMQPGGNAGRANGPFNGLPPFGGGNNPGGPF